MADDASDDGLYPYLETTVWIVASLLGPIPWVYLAAVWLEQLAGLDGYSAAFIGAPALWTGLCLAAFLSRRPWAAAVFALSGAAIWWGIVQ